MINWAEVISTGVELAPTIGIVLLAAWAMWLFWRMVRRVLQAFGQRSRSSEDMPRVHRDFERREPTLEPASPSVSPDLNASEILALKASIDALSRQVENLTRTLSVKSEPGPDVNGRLSPKMAGKENVTISIEPKAFAGPVRPVQSRALTEKTS